MTERERRIDKLKEALQKKLSNENSDRSVYEAKEIKYPKIEDITEENIDVIVQKDEKKEIEQKIQQKMKKSDKNLNNIIYILSFVSITLLVFALYVYNNLETTKIVYKQSEPKEIIKEVIKEKIVVKNSFDEKIFKEYYNKKDFNSYKCYDFKVASAIFPNSCRKSLESFLNKFKNSIKYEVIPVVSQKDIEFFSKKELSENENEYILRGFSRQRVLDSTFYIKKYLEEDDIIVPTNYYVKSLKDNRGIIIKAYK